MSSDLAMGTGFAGLFNRSLGADESMGWVVVAMMFGGWRRSLKDARVSAEAWERSADRTQPEYFSYGTLSCLLLSTRPPLYPDQAF